MRIAKLTSACAVVLARAAAFGASLLVFLEAAAQPFEGEHPRTAWRIELRP